MTRCRENPAPEDKADAGHSDRQAGASVRYDHTVAVIPKLTDDDIHVNLRWYRGRWLCDIRLFMITRKRPKLTTRGITTPPQMVGDLINTLNRLGAECFGCGLLR